MAALPDINVKLNVDVDIKVNVSDVPEDVRVLADAEASKLYMDELAKDELAKGEKTREQIRDLARAKRAEVIASLTAEPDPAPVLPPFGDE